MGTFTNREDPDDNVAFHQGLYCLLSYKRSSDEKCNICFNHNLTPLDMYNGPSQVCYIKPEENKSISIHTVRPIIFIA